MKRHFILAIVLLVSLASLDLFAESECTGLSFDPAMEYYVDSEDYYHPNDLVTMDLTGLPANHAGILSLSIYAPTSSESWTNYAAVGSYDLGTGDNVSYETCSQCVQMYLYKYDAESDQYSYVSQFYQQSGTLQITRTDFSDDDYPYYEGILSVKLAEAEIDDDTFETSFVEGGDCYEVESATWSNFPEGYGSSDPEPEECTGLSFDPAMEYYVDSENYYHPNNLVTYDLSGLPANHAGFLSLSIYAPTSSESWTNYAAVGSYDLGTGDNVSYETCSQCVQMYLYEYNAESEQYSYVSQFYQQSGTLQITRTDFSDTSYPYYEGILTVKLAEAEIDDDTFETTFAENGACYEVESAAWSNFPDDGDTGDTEVPGDTGDTEVPGDTGDTGSGECTGLSFDPAVEYYVDSDDYYYPNDLVTMELTGIPSEYVGLLSLEFFPDDLQNGDWKEAAAVGNYDLSTGHNANYATCNQCVRLGIYDPNNDYAKVGDFFQQTGTLKVTRTDFSDDDYPYYEGVVTVKLAEATFASGTYESTFTPGGACYEVESAAWSNFPEDYSDTGDTSDTGSTPDTGDTGDTEVPGDTGDTEVPGDTGDTEVPGDTGDTEVSGDTGDTEAPGDTGSEPTDTGNEQADTGSTEVPGDTGDTEPVPEPGDTDSEPTDGNQTPAEEDEDSSGCALVTL